MQPCLFTALNRHAFLGAFHPDLDRAREELIESFNEGKCDSMLVMFLIPVKEVPRD